MDTNFFVETDAASNLLKVTLSGFMVVEDMALLRQAILTGIAALHCPKGRHLAIYDVRTCKIQPQNVVSILRSMSDAKGVAARRIAVVVGDSLMRMQLPRILVGRDARIFDEVTPAIVWLKSDTGIGLSLMARQTEQPQPRSLTVR